MKIKNWVLALSLAACPLAHAQIVVGTYTQGSASSNSSFSSGPAGAMGVTVIGNEVSTLATGVFTSQPTLGSVSSSVSYNQYVSFTTSMPIEIQDFTAAFMGSFTYVGGDISFNKSQFTLNGSLGIFEFGDTNSNGQYDDGEVLTEIMSTGVIPLGMHANAGTIGYNQVVPIPNSSSFVLNAGSNYVIQSQTSISQLGATSANLPGIDLVVDYSNSTFAGNELGFTYDVVPEPGAMLVAGFAAILVAARKRKR